MAMPRWSGLRLLLLFIAELLMRSSSQELRGGAGRYIISTFPNLHQILYLNLPDPVWRPLVASGLVSPTAICVDQKNFRVFVADTPALSVYWYQLHLLDNGKLMTDGRRHTAAKMISATGLAVDNVGSLYISGTRMVAPPLTPVPGILLQPSLIIATSANDVPPPDPIELWTPYNTAPMGEGSARISSPSSVAVDAFHLFWSNGVDGTANGAVIKGGLTVPQADPPGSLVPQADNVDTVKAMVVTATAVFYAAEGGIYGIPKAKMSLACGTNSTQCPMVAEVQEPTSLVWDGDGTLFYADQESGSIYSVPSGTLSMHESTLISKAGGVWGIGLFNNPSGATSCRIAFAALLSVAAAVLQVFS